MPTSIRDLINALEHDAGYAAGAESQARDAVGALAELGRALRQLAQDGLDSRLNGRRESIALDLADSCATTAARINLDRDGRLTALAGGLADVVAVLREETGRDQRWAITVEVASVVRVLSAYAVEGDARRTADLAWTHLTARALVVQALQDAPQLQSRAVLDRLVPRTMLPPDVTPTGAALESLTVISDRLRRSAAELGRRPTLLEVFAVTRAAESTTRYATTAAAVLAGETSPDARPAAAIWYEVRDRLRPFVSTAALRLEDRDLGLWAQRAHSELRREFGSPDAPQLFNPDGELKDVAVRNLQAMMNEIPAIAEHVATAVQQLADHGELHALANRLPFREQRSQQFFGHRAVVADRFDVVTVLDRLGDAAKLGAEVATSLNHRGGSASPTVQPDLTAANAARAAAAQADPHAALVDHARDAMSAAGEAAGEPATDRAAELGLDDPSTTYEIDSPAGPDWDVD